MSKEWIKNVSEASLDDFLKYRLDDNEHTNCPMCKKKLNYEIEKATNNCNITLAKTNCSCGFFALYRVDDIDTTLIIGEICYGNKDSVGGEHDSGLG